MFSDRKPFNVKLQGRAGLIYEEQDKSLCIDSEMLAGPDFDIVIYLDSIRNWNSPYEAEVLSGADKQRIKANITKALTHLKIDWV